MADDLGNEWWLDAKDSEDTAKDEETKKKKRKREEPSAHILNSDISDKAPDVNDTNKVKTKKKQKKPKIESITTTLDGSKVTDVLWSTFCNCTSGSLSALELEDIMIDESCCLTDDTVHTGALEEFSAYLTQVIPKWSGRVTKLNKKGHRGCPLLLVVSSAATRIVELNRASVKFKGDCKTVKLFAKHIKISEQEHFLESYVVHFGLGTPSRILKLLQNGSLKTSRLKYVILDWTWRDKKLRSMIDIPEVQKELVILLKDYIFPLAKASKLKIGLF
ncbi:protein CMSS1-like [Montipora foliosa]|uniref:protein CMSS1-like n=1 Tax=Montipora foliosa TaxID=591990 RepID=UPI0035F17E60